jgi:hypothetical protein
MGERGTATANANGEGKGKVRFESCSSWTAWERGVEAVQVAT